jgi:multidrug efflux system membrane fusion protein
LIDNAKANLDYATIKAPLTGRTGIRLVDKGNLVSATDATGIVIITQLRPIAVVFTLPENTVADVLDAQALGPVELQAIAGGKVLGEGKLLVVDNQIDQTTGTYRIKGTFPNEQNRLWPGQFVNVKLKLKVLQNVIVVPSVAVQQGPNGSYVYTVTPESTVKVTNAGVVQEGERQTVIGSGVNAGDTIVTTGFANLQDGSKVRLEAAPAAAQAAGSPPPEAPASDSGSDQQRRARGGDAAAGEGVGSKGEQRHRRKERQGGEQPGSASAAPAGQSTKKP